MALSCVSFAPKSMRPEFDHSVDDEPADCVCILSVGVPFRYVIPSFDVLCVEMRQMRIKGYTAEGEERTYDMFIRNDPSLCRPYPAWMTILDATSIEESEFSICVDISKLKLVPQGVLFVWEWECEDGDIDHVSESSCEDVGHAHLIHYILSSESGSESEHETDFQLPSQTHIVVFKCIGTVHDVNAQTILRSASKQLEKEDVPVRIVPEPENQYDAQAIAFQCKVDGEWSRIGYIVREALHHVHQALAQRRIIYVKFAWIKYLVVWMRSGPGFYAGIKIAVNGEWPAEVCRCASTR